MNNDVKRLRTAEKLKGAWSWKPLICKKMKLSGFFSESTTFWKNTYSIRDVRQHWNALEAFFLSRVERPKAHAPDTRIYPLLDYPALPIAANDIGHFFHVMRNVILMRSLPWYPGALFDALWFRCRYCVERRSVGSILIDADPQLGAIPAVLGNNALWSFERRQISSNLVFFLPLSLWKVLKYFNFFPCFMPQSLPFFLHPEK